jgi:hypothetical protein
MTDQVKPLESLMEEIPPDKLTETVDSVMIEYAIACVQDLQNHPPDEAVSNIRTIKRLRDALWKTALKVTNAIHPLK